MLALVFYHTAGGIIPVSSSDVVNLDELILRVVNMHLSMILLLLCLVPIINTRPRYWFLPTDQEFYFNSANSPAMYSPMYSKQDVPGQCPAYKLRICTGRPITNQCQYDNDCLQHSKCCNDYCFVYKVCTRIRMDEANEIPTDGDLSPKRTGAPRKLPAEDDYYFVDYYNDNADDVVTLPPELTTDGVEETDEVVEKYLDVENEMDETTLEATIEDTVSVETENEETTSRDINGSGSGDSEAEDDESENDYADYTTTPKAVSGFEISTTVRNTDSRVATTTPGDVGEETGFDRSNVMTWTQTERKTKKSPQVRSRPIPDDITEGSGSGDDSEDDTEDDEDLDITGTTSEENKVTNDTAELAPQVKPQVSFDVTEKTEGSGSGEKPEATTVEAEPEEATEETESEETTSRYINESGGSEDDTEDDEDVDVTGKFNVAATKTEQKTTKTSQVRTTPIPDDITEGSGRGDDNEDDTEDDEDVDITGATSEENEITNNAAEYTTGILQFTTRTPQLAPQVTAQVSSGVTEETEGSGSGENIDDTEDDYEEFEYNNGLEDTAYAESRKRDGRRRYRQK